MGAEQISVSLCKNVSADLFMLVALRPSKAYCVADCQLPTDGLQQ